MRAVRSLVALLVAGCSGVPFPAVDPAATVDGAVTPGHLLFRTDAPVQLLARVVLTTGDTSLDFSLAARVDPNGEVRAAGLSDLGGTLFEATARDGVVDLRACAPLLSPSVPAAVLSVLETTLLPGADSGWSPVALRDDGQPAWSRATAAQRVLAWSGTPDGPVDHWLVGADDTAARSIVVATWHADPYRPERIEAEELGQGIALVLFVADWKVRDPRGS